MEILSKVFNKLLIGLLNLKNICFDTNIIEIETLLAIQETKMYFIAAILNFQLFGGKKWKDFVVPGSFEFSIVQSPMLQIFMLLCECAHTLTFCYISAPLYEMWRNINMLWTVWTISGSVTSLDLPTSRHPRKHETLNLIQYWVNAGPMSWTVDKLESTLEFLLHIHSIHVKSPLAMKSNTYWYIFFWRHRKPFLMATLWKQCYISRPPHTSLH